MSIERFEECNGDMMSDDKGQWCLYFRDVEPVVAALKEKLKRYEGSGHGSLAALGEALDEIDKLKDDPIYALAKMLESEITRKDGELSALRDEKQALIEFSDKSLGDCNETISALRDEITSTQDDLISSQSEICKLQMTLSGAAELGVKGQKELSALRDEIKVLRDAIATTPEDTFGCVTDSPDQQGWFIRDELVDGANKVLEVKG